MEFLDTTFGDSIVILRNNIAGTDIGGGTAPPGSFVTIHNRAFPEADVVLICQQSISFSSLVPTGRAGTEELQSIQGLIVVHGTSTSWIALDVKTQNFGDGVEGVDRGNHKLDICLQSTSFINFRFDTGLATNAHPLWHNCPSHTEMGSIFQIMSNNGYEHVSVPATPGIEASILLIPIASKSPMDSFKKSAMCHLHLHALNGELSKMEVPTTSQYGCVEVSSRFTRSLALIQATTDFSMTSTGAVVRAGNCFAVD